MQVVLMVGKQLIYLLFETDELSHLLLFFLFQRFVELLVAFGGLVRSK